MSHGYSLGGAAEILGWAKARVTARAKILELPEAAQQMIGTGEIPVSGVDVLLQIAASSPPLCEAAVATVADGHTSAAQLARDPAWAIGHAVRNGSRDTFAAYLSTVSSYEVAELKLGKKTQAALDEAEQLHKQIDRYAFGPPPIRFADTDVDQARAAGVLIEFERGAPIICDRGLYRELVKSAIARTVEELRAANQATEAERSERPRQGQRERTPAEDLDAEHRAAVRELTARAHNTNLDLGAALLDGLAVVDPGDMDVARFFALCRRSA